MHTINRREYIHNTNSSSAQSTTNNSSKQVQIIQAHYRSYNSDVLILVVSPFSRLVDTEQDCIQEDHSTKEYGEEPTHLVKERPLQSLYSVCV